MQEFHSLTGLASAFQRPRGYPITLGPPAPVKCPRCESTNTKFCYYNNYNLSQPRHFCKSCRRYWTRGGLLRNVPVGGGTRKSKSKSKSKTKSKKSFHVVEDNNNPNPNPNPSPEVPSTSENDIRGPIAIADPTMGFGFPDMMPQMGGNEFPTLHGNLCTNGDGFSGNNGNGSLFDVTGSVTYWNNHCSWADADPSALYLS